MAVLYGTESTCCKASVVINESQGSTVCAGCYEFDPPTRIEEVTKRD